MKIKFLFEKHYALGNRLKIKRVIGKIFMDFNKELDSLNIIFCSDEFLLTINQKYLKHDFYTDIITFDLSSDETIIGEIYISLERVKENAGLLNINFSQELMRVIFHGALHLAGLNDKTPQQKAQMTQQENKYLTLL